MRLICAAFVASITFVSSVAQAQDAPSSSATTETSMPDSETPYIGARADDAPAEIDGSFGGFRVEGDLGWDKLQAFGRNNEKLGYGGMIGFDGNLNKTITIGPEFSYWRPNHGRSTVVSSEGDLAQQGRDIYGAAVRVGYRAGPDLILFGKAGYANQRQRTYTLVDNEAVDRFDDHVGGYQFGGGFQYALHDHFSFAPANVYLSGQYVYSRFDNGTKDQHAMVGVGIKFR